MCDVAIRVAQKALYHIIDGANVGLGFVPGAGADVKFSHSLSLGMEGMYYFFDAAALAPSFTPRQGPQRVVSTMTLCSESSARD